MKRRTKAISKGWNRNKVEGTIDLIIALIILISAFWEPTAAATFGVGALLVLAIYRWFVKK